MTEPFTKEAIKPFIKWVGGKRSKLNDICRLVPKHYKRYCEPFVGGGALFFALQPKVAILGDTNKELIYLYKAIRSDWQTIACKVDELLLNFSNNQFDALRVRLNSLKNKKFFLSKEEKLEIATLFYYIIKTSYNGIVQVNKVGDYTMPAGREDKIAFCDKVNLKTCSKLLKKTSLMVGSYEKFKPKKGDFFFLDPPYDGAFARYSSTPFTKKNQTELAVFCKKINAKGGRFILCNSRTRHIEKLYRPFYKLESKSFREGLSPYGNSYKDEKDIPEVFISNLPILEMQKLEAEERTEKERSANQIKLFA